MAARAPRHMTLAGFLDWDDGTDTRYELIDGEVVAMAPALPAHGTIVSNLDRAIGQRLQSPWFALAGAGVVRPDRLAIRTWTWPSPARRPRPSLETRRQRRRL